MLLWVDLFGLGEVSQRDLHAPSELVDFRHSGMFYVRMLLLCVSRLFFA